MSRSLSNDKIGPAQWMTIDAVCFLGIGRCWAYSAQQVLPLRDRFHMERVHAQPISAQVVKVKPTKDGTVNEFVRKLMSTDVAIVPKVAVPFGLQSASPKPATGIGFGENLLKESLGWGAWSFVPSHAGKIRILHNMGNK